jgi:plastocyanin
MTSNKVRTRGTAGSGVALGLSLILGLASCSSSTSTPSATTPSATTAPSTSGSTLQQGAGDQLVFNPTTLTVKHGTTITVSNVTASTPHTFTITGKGIDITNDGGKSQQVTINLPPGTYPFFCRFHVSLGMKGTLVVN